VLFKQLRESTLTKASVKIFFLLTLWGRRVKVQALLSSISSWEHLTVWKKFWSC